MFTALAPNVFRAIRFRFGISEDEFLLYLGIESFLFQLLFSGEFLSYRTTESYGKSGSKFLHTPDIYSKYMVKTIKENEALCLYKNLYKYYNHIFQADTMLVPCLGLYKIIEHPSEETVYICVMKNLFSTPNKINEIFDLKGATYDRKTAPEDRKPGVPLKDQDFGDRTITLEQNIKKKPFYLK